jgi:hypothetical protein
MNNYLNQLVCAKTLTLTVWSIICALIVRRRVHCEINVVARANIRSMAFRIDMAGTGRNLGIQLGNFVGKP